MNELLPIAYLINGFLVLLLYCYHVLRFSVNQPENNEYRIFSSVLSLVMILQILGSLIYLGRNFNSVFQYENSFLTNIVLVLGGVLFIVVRWIIYGEELRLSGTTHKAKPNFNSANLHKLLGLLATPCHILLLITTTQKSNESAFYILGMSTAVLGIFSTLKYRLFDDYVKREIPLTGNYQNGELTEDTPAAVYKVNLFQGLHLVFKAYLTIVISYAFIYTIYCHNDIGYCCKERVFQINYCNNSDTDSSALVTSSLSQVNTNFDTPFLFSDFVYFSVITFNTVGYGDILPLDTIMRYIVMSEIILGYFFISIVLTIIIAKFTTIKLSKSDRGNDS